MCGLVLGFIFLLGQKNSQGQTTGDFSQIQTQLDKLSSQLNTMSTQISNKLDSVLSNQEKILSELEIVKVRASRR